MYTKTADEIVALDPEIAVIPVGSLEQHGPHLPVMTDWAIAMELGKRVADKMGAYLLPALPISTCREHMGKKGSVWMEPTTFYQMMTDIVMSLKVQGFKKVAIVQCHGGIFVMTPLVRDLNAKNNPDMMVAVTYPGDFAIQLEQEGIIVLADGVGISATKDDIIENPLGIEIVEMKAELLTTTLQDVDMAVINGNYAIGAGLKVADALAVEAADGAAADAYMNVIAVMKGNENNEKIQALIKALKSDEAKAYMEKTYEGAVVPLF